MPIQINPNSLSPTLLAVLRYACTAFATYLATHGFITNDTAQGLVGALVVVSSTGIGAFLTWRGNEQKKAMEPFVPNHVAGLKRVPYEEPFLCSPVAVVVAVLLAIVLLSGCTHGKFDRDKAVALTRTSYAAARNTALACIAVRIKYCVAREPQIRDIIRRGDDLDEQLAKGAGDQVSLDLLATTGELKGLGPR